MKPIVKPGWLIETTRGPLAEPGQHPHAGEVTEAVKTITYSGGLIRDDQFDDFPITFYTSPEVGRVLEFPVLQSCLVGETNWANPGGQEPDPAPRLTLTDPSALDTPVHALVVGEQAAGLSSPVPADTEGRTQLFMLTLVALSAVLSGSSMVMAYQQRRNA